MLLLHTYVLSLRNNTVEGIVWILQLNSQRNVVGGVSYGS